jgi:cytochrome P450
MDHTATAALTLQARPPRPKGGTWSNLKRFGTEPLAFLTETARECGDVAGFRLLFRTYLLNAPDLVEQVLAKDGYKTFVKGKLYDRIRPLVGEGVLTSDGEIWSRQRKMMQKSFRTEAYKSYVKVMREEAASAAIRLTGPARSGQAVDVYAEMNRLTLRIVGRTLFGIDLESDLGRIVESISCAVETIHRWNHSIVFAPWLPTPTNLRFKRAMRKLDDVVRTIVASRKAGDDGRDDMLSLLLSAVENSDIPAKRVRDEVATLIFAGHETTAIALTWSLWLLSRHPDAEAKLLREIDDVVGDREPTFEDAMRLEYAGMVVQEAMRLYPPIWLLGRLVKEDVDLRGWRVKKGSCILLSPYVMHRHPAYWDEPELFRPERFAKDAADARHKFLYFPFSAGPRKCVGDAFAMIEAKIVLVSILRRWRLSPVSPIDPVPEPSLTLRPKDGLPMIVSPR